ncbi:MAG: lysoplasmalogenase [Chloroflexota bacterium]
MNFNLLYLTIGIAMLNWLASAKKWKNLVYITKPGTILVLLAWLWQTGHFQGPMIWFALGLIFSLAGDIFLMLPQEKFMAGLVSFLLGHIAYIIGLTPRILEFNVASYLVMFMVGMTAFRLYRRITANLGSSGKQKTRGPIMIYFTAIGLMVTAALLTMTTSDWNTWASLSVSGGALFFLVSDSWLAWDRFVAPLKNRDLRIMVTYHLGQIGLVIGAVINFLP